MNSSRPDTRTLIVFTNIKAYTILVVVDNFTPSSEIYSLMFGDINMYIHALLIDINQLNWIVITQTALYPFTPLVL